MNQKGGVGKTTTVLNLGHAIALAGQRVLLIDLDPQSHLTDSLGLHAYEGEGVDSVVLDGKPISQHSLAIRDNMLLLPSGPRLSALETVKEGGAQRGWRLHKALEKVENIDYVLIDCPPSAGLITMNGLVAAQELIIPVSSDYLSLHGLSRLMPILDHLNASLKKSTRRWVLLTRFQRQRRLAQEVQQKLQEHFADSLLSTPIRENVSLAESPSYGQTIFEYKKNSYGAEDYMALAVAILQQAPQENNVHTAVC